MNEEKKKAIEKMEEQRDKLNARLVLLRNREKRDERKRDARRKIIAGAHLIKTMRGDIQAVGKWLERGGALAERDRKLFGLGAADTNTENNPTS